MASNKGKVVINSFKDTGKWNVKHTYETSLPGFESKQLVEEAQQKFPYLKDSNFTIKVRYPVEGGTALNFRLIIKGIYE